MNLAFALERVYAAPPERVWSAFTSPVVMAQWFCPNPSLPTTCTLDVRPGGAWRCEMGGHVVSGVYVDVVPHARLSFTWSWAHAPEDPVTTVVVSFAPEGAGTHLRLEHAETEPGVGDDGHRGGWKLTLTRLEAALG